MVGLQVLSHPLDPLSASNADPEDKRVDWRVASGRQQGRAHVATSVPCQDQVTTLALPDGTVVGALADGAGSARFSHYGAELVVTRASRLVAELFEPLFRATNNLGTLRARVVQELQGILARAASGGLDVTEDDRRRLGLPDRFDTPLIPCDLRDLATTVLVVAVRGDRYVALHLGDGAIGTENVLKSGTRIVRALGIPDNGEFANETTFITSRDAAGSLRIYRGRVETTSRSIAGFVLMSDGPEASLYRKSTRTMATACSKLLQGCRELPSDIMAEQLGQALRDVIAPRTHDDCSLVLVARG